MTTLDTTPSRERGLRTLAMAGLKIGATPILAVETVEHRRLFEIREQIGQVKHALALLRETYAATPEAKLSGDDARIFKDQVARRQRQLADLKLERDEMLLVYGEQLLDSAKIHPDLDELVASVPLAIEE